MTKQYLRIERTLILCTNVFRHTLWNLHGDGREERRLASLIDVISFIITFVRFEATDLFDKNWTYFRDTF